ncbi:uncharacterized protein FIBRA_07982 [Fibroporia radiculosa]|uniref:Uncharacterized protein n=1 Tax=Fibroporia radiculosa TaxID=599839 RepID=J4GVY9_9APHY|nr:uncharacterized protein FIBRA_07982 [Fibroporia radiculosa]CCM05750.1 predicted protein [Fibroporia radiculosa]
MSEKCSKRVVDFQHGTRLRTARRAPCDAETGTLAAEIEHRRGSGSNLEATRRRPLLLVFLPYVRAGWGREPKRSPSGIVSAIRTMTCLLSLRYAAGPIPWSSGLTRSVLTSVLGRTGRHGTASQPRGVQIQILTSLPSIQLAPGAVSHVHRISSTSTKMHKGAHCPFNLSAEPEGGIDALPIAGTHLLFSSPSRQSQGQEGEWERAREPKRRRARAGSVSMVFCCTPRTKGRIRGKWAAPRLPPHIW